MDEVTIHDRDLGSVRSSADSADRAGAYHGQPEGYRAFVPKALPPSPPSGWTAIYRPFSRKPLMPLVA